MTESDIYNIIRPWVLPHGKILRIENTVSVGTVDAIMFYHGLALMMEFKVIKHSKIKIRRFQLAAAVDYTKNSVPDNQYNFVCSGDDSIGIELYPFSVMRHVPYTLTPNDDLMFNLTNAKPTHIWRNKSDFNSWLTQFNTGETK